LNGSPKKENVIMTHKSITLFVMLLLITFGVSVAIAAPPLPGAIFTTTVDGTIVNENVRYEAKEDVYLDGGPGPNAPSTAAGLPEGDYYFQVTDPSGKDLLSTDHISCRRIHVNEFGVIDFVYPGTNYEYQNGKDGVWMPVPCQHAQGVDVDHSELGAITVQLYPYDDTPNKGGVYKAWVTPVGDYAGDPNYVPDEKKDAVNGEDYGPGYFHGFIPAKSKTDNYKVKEKGPPYVPPVITVRKFHDKNLNGVQDAGEEDVAGWAVDFTDLLGVVNTLYTPDIVLATEPGDYTFVEDEPPGTLQTVSYLDGTIVSLYPTAGPTVVVAVAGDSEETHEVVYGNVGLGQATACKVYDRNGDGVADSDEPGVEGWQMQLTGTDVLGNLVGPIVQFTGADGCTTFSNLLPGDYKITEVMPANDGWFASGPTSQMFTIVSTLNGSTMSGSSFTFNFTNYYLGTAAFDTKGYWHNKNGLSELTEADRVYVNSLTPYSSPSSYFGAGDEPFDGFFADGTSVDAAFNDNGVEIWGAGTWQAEVSHFLVDANAGGDPREQLAQQLLAFIFNARHRLVDLETIIQLPDGTLVSAQSLIDAAINAWAGNDAVLQNSIESLLDYLNNSDNLLFISNYPGPIIYP
jgi:hypothetical protein